MSERASEVERWPLSSTASSPSGMRTLRSAFVPPAQQQTALSDAVKVPPCRSLGKSLLRSRLHPEETEAPLRGVSGAELLQSRPCKQCWMRVLLAATLMGAGCEPCCCRFGSPVAVSLSAAVTG